MLNRGYNNNYYHNMYRQQIKEVTLCSGGLIGLEEGLCCTHACTTAINCPGMQPLLYCGADQGTSVSVSGTTVAILDGKAYFKAFHSFG